MVTPKSIIQPVDGANELVSKLIDKAHANFDINYEGYLANHLSHALYTLCALGASKSRLQEFNDLYVKKLEPLRKPTSTLNEFNWTESMGNDKFYSEFIQFFDGEISSKGMKGTIDMYVGQLLGESIGAALHPLIHMGYATEFSNSKLLSEGLAYTCIYPLKNTDRILDGIDSTYAGNETVLSIIEELQGIQLPELSTDIGTFHHKMQFLLENHGKVFRNLIAKWDLTQIDQLPAKLNELTEASILSVFATYADRIDFFLLHGVTGNHAVRIILPHLSVEHQRRILRINLLALLTDYVIQRKPKIDVGFITGYNEMETDENISWDNVVRKAISIDEEHVSKIIRVVIHYMETVPMSQRSMLFSEQFLKRCSFKAVDILQDIEDYIF